METKLTFKQIMDKLETVYLEVRAFAYGSSTEVSIPEDFEPITNTRDWAVYGNRLKNYLNHIGVGEFKQVEQYGGEGEGETWHVVYYFVEHDVYIRVDGFYQSYDGTEFYDGWGCCREVRPKEKTITVYE